jgi:isopenicillin N synthase-like dioxygenase
VELSAGGKIPIIDFTGLTGGDWVLRKATAMSMREAFEDFGFIYLKNHSVPQSVVDELFSRSIAFFDLPQATKAQAGGYRGAGLSGLDPTKPTDVKERFRAPYDPNLPPGYWPERLPNFQEAIAVFREAGLSVLRQVMQGVALSLELPEAYFDSAHEPHTGAVMLLHYPPITEPYCRDSSVRSAYRFWDDDFALSSWQCGRFRNSEARWHLAPCAFDSRRGYRKCGRSFDPLDQWATSVRAAPRRSA